MEEVERIADQAYPDYRGMRKEKTVEPSSFTSLHHQQRPAYWQQGPPTGVERILVNEVKSRRE
jgi:hypothetical protein